MAEETFTCFVVIVLSQRMFRKLKDRFLSSWRTDGEQWLAYMFHDLYLDNNMFNRWKYNVSEIPGCIPQNNSNGERKNLNT
jgi:hypothetical protein